MMKPRILYLCHRIPYPPDKGDKIRSWKTLEHLTRRFRVHLGAFVDDAADFRHEGRLKSVCEEVALVPLKKPLATLKSARGLLTGEPLTLAFYRDARLTAFVASARSLGLSLEMAFSSSMAQYIERQSNAPRIVDLCDADSAKWAEYARKKHWPMSAVYECEARLLAKEETKIINWADAAFAISEEEADLLGNRDGVEREVGWFCNGVDAAYFAPGASSVGESCTAVFIGAMDYWANIDAVLWFARDIWPKVREAAPEATFAIVGSNPVREILKLHGVDGVTVTGRVKDVRPYLESAAFAVAPMRIARGVQNKVLEAMAMEKTVIATPAALEGIDATIGREAIAAASANAFAAEVIRLAGDPAAAKKIGEAARSRVLESYQWPLQLSRLDSTIDRLIAR